MKKILYLISTMISSPRTVSFPVNQAQREQAELIACFVISNRIPKSVSSWLIYIGFMGDKPSGELESAINEHYRQRAQAQLKEIERVATEQGISCRTQLLEGDLVEEGIRLAETEQVDLVLLNEPDRADFHHLVFGPIKEELTRRLRCPMKVIEEELSGQ